VSRHPADRAALEALAEAYLAGGAPGLAVSAIDRAPDQVKGVVRIADARARALTELGRPEAALATQRRVLEACEKTSCSPSLVARAERRARWLGELVRQGIDPLAEPERTLLAYRVAVREVRLDGP
jgi:hypothetical protein